MEDENYYSYYLLYVTNFKTPTLALVLFSSFSLWMVGKLSLLLIEKEERNFFMMMMGFIFKVFLYVCVLRVEKVYPLIYSRREERRYICSIIRMLIIL